MDKSTKFWMCIAGIALVALGVMCIVYPMATLLSLSWLISLLFLIGGCTQMAAWGKLHKIMQRSALNFFSALLQIILGLLMLFQPAPVMIMLPFLFAFWLLFEGLNLAISSFDFKQIGFQYWWIMLCLGLIAACFGGYCFFLDPEVAAKTIAWLVGLGIIIDGIAYWVKVALVNKVEHKLHGLADRFYAAVEEVAQMPEEAPKA